ncbi:MAG TPA: COX15/CtaA family protein [Actinotalea sp.]|nr:COX15/CtaA family protein [Actinotalea sp.]
MSSLTEPPSAPPAPRTGWRPSRTLTRRVLWANLVGQVVIVVTGGAVRLTGSGLGCSTWPECEPGEFTPVLHEATTWHPLIEFANRTLTGVLVLLAVATAVVVLRGPRRPRSVRLLALVPLIGVLLQAVVGGISVLVDLHPAVVGSHFLISMVLVAASAALVLREAQPDGPARVVVGARARTLSLVLVPLGVAVLGLGVVVTGSGPHSGDDDAASRWALDPAAISRVHSLSVWLYTAVLVAVLLLLRREATTGDGPVVDAHRATRVLLAVTLAQALIGYVQYLTGLPELLVAAHMLGACLLVMAQTAQLAAQTVRGPVRAAVA